MNNFDGKKEDTEANSAVVAWRLGRVEDSVKELDGKLDRVISEYPTHTILANLLAPMNREIRDLKEAWSKEREEKAKGQQQLRIAVLTAIFSPVATFIVTMVMVNNLGAV